MRLYWNSTTFYIAWYITHAGNFSYSSLKLLPVNYETAKDSVQKLMRCGYVAAVKAPHVKSLYITPEGRMAVERVLLRQGMQPLPKVPILYHPPKAVRADKLNETALLFELAELSEHYDSARDIKRTLEQEAARSSDQLKYSRFVGLWRRAASCSLVYHFGYRNARLNPNGETNALFLAQRYNKNVERLILGDNMGTMLAILRHTQMMEGKSTKQRKHMNKLNFTVYTGDHHIFFLPVTSTSIDILQMMHNDVWSEWIAAIQKQFSTPDRAVWGMLDCGMRGPIYNLLYPDVTPVMIS